MRWRQALHFGGFLSVLHLLAVTAATAAPAQDPADPVQSSIRILTRAAHPQRDGSHLPLLFALRQLRDGDLRSMFYQLAQSGEWQMQVHAVLGLAEIDPTRRVDPWMVAQIKPEAQETAVATALDLDLLGVEQMKTILAGDKLHFMARLLLLAEMISLQEHVDQSELSRLASSEDNHIAGFAACLLAQIGDVGPLRQFMSKLKPESSVDDRDALSIWLLDAVRRYDLAAAIDLPVMLLENAQLNPDVASRAVWTLFDLNPERGQQAWEIRLGTEPTYQQRVRYGLILLAMGLKSPASAYERLGGVADEPLLEKMIEVGRALATQADPVDAVIGLLDLNHPKTTAWAMNFVNNDLPRDQAARVYAHIIDRVPQNQPGQGDWLALAIESATKLHEIDPGAVLSRLQQAEDDSLLQETILLGLFETSSPDVGQAAGKLRRIGSGQADSLTLLLVAKHSLTLTDEDLKQLGVIASGGGRVSELVQVQAAWLYLKHTKQTETALAAVFADARN